MTRQSDNDIYRFIVKPMIILLGIYIASVLVDSMLGLNNQTFQLVFTGVGGVPFLIYYFKKEIEK